MFSANLAIAILVLCAAGVAQTGNGSLPHGRITISATVAGSSTLVLGPNGTQHLLVANAAPEEIAVLTSNRRAALQYPAPGISTPPLFPEGALRNAKQKAESQNGCKARTLLPTKNGFHYQGKWPGIRLIFYRSRAPHISPGALTNHRCRTEE